VLCVVVGTDGDDDDDVDDVVFALGVTDRL
jgi:hypothetical protein